MGQSLSRVCLSDTSIAESPAEIAPGTQQVKYVFSGPLLDIPTEEPSSSPRSVDSSQSVLTVISPRKDKVRNRSSFQSPFSNPLSARLSAVASIHQATINSLSQQETILSIVSSGDVAALGEYLQQNSVDVTLVKLQNLQYTPLHVAVLHNQLAMVEYLLSEGVDVDAKDRDGQSAVFLAYTLGLVAVADALVTHKAAALGGGSPYSPYASSSTANTLRDGSDSRSVRSRAFSVNQDEADRGGITVQRFSSFRSIQSMRGEGGCKGPEPTADERRCLIRPSNGLKLSLQPPSPPMTDSAGSLAITPRKSARPMSKRLKKAAGRVIHLVLPAAVTGRRNRLTHG